MNHLKPFALELQHDHGAFFRVLGGEPQTAGMKSGLVTLQPYTSVGEHNTGNREEILLILKGSGEAHVAGADPLSITSDMAVYIPPNHQHDIKNTGDTCLTYVYIVAPVLSSI